MSSTPIFSSLTIHRPFFPESSPHPQKISAAALLTRSVPNVVSASRLEVRPTPELVSCGIGQVDAMTGGLPRGCLTEVCGPNSSGCTSFLLAALLAATQRAEVCALVDVSDAFDPASAASAGIDLQKLLWVRCGVSQNRKPDREGHDFSRAAKVSLGSRALAPEGKKINSFESPVEQALRVTDLLLQSGGFGLVAIDLADVSFKIARRIPLASWFRFQRAVEHTTTVLLLITPAPCTQSCATLLLNMQSVSLGKKPPSFSSQFSLCDIPVHAELLQSFETRAEVLRSRIERKPASSVTTFTTKAVRTG
jgi:hypothetical protein